MNWSKAKSIMIVILIAINVILFFSSQYTRVSDSLSLESQKAIVKLLKQNGIELSADFPKDFSPMQQIGFLYKDNDIDALKEAFFGSVENVTRTVESDATILRKDNKTLAIEGANVLYTNKDNIGDIKGLEATIAKKISDQFVKNNLKSKYSNYKYFSTFIYNNTYCLSYYETYKNYSIYSNSINVYITKKGIERVELSSYEIKGFEGIDREICSADEALLTFMYGVYDKGNKMNGFIDKVELGYILEETDQKSTNGRAIPCYIISVKGNNKIYYINAYSNTII